MAEKKDNSNLPPAAAAAVVIGPVQIKQAKDGLAAIIQRNGALRRQVMGLAMTTKSGNIYGNSGGDGSSNRQRIPDNYSHTRPTNAQEFDKRMAGLDILETYLVGEAAMYAESEANAGEWLADLSRSLQEKDNLEVGIMLLISRAQPDVISEQGFKTAIDNIKRAGLWPWPV